MKKKLILGLVFIFLFSFCLNLKIEKENNFSVYAISDSFEQFQKEFSEMVADDNFDNIYIEENENYETFLKKVGKENEFPQMSTFSLDSREESFTYVNNSNIAQICEEYELGYIETETGYDVYSLYKVKRLIVSGKVKNSYNAKKLLTYKNYNVLSYETEEETKYAYQNLSLDDSLNVLLDSPIKVSDTNIKTEAYTYTQYQNQWGTQAIDLGYYNEYLKTNNSGEEVIVAVIDTGVQTSHNIFTNRILKDSSGNNVGYTYSTSATGYYYKDGVGHGTHVAGIIADMTPTNVKILPMKVFDDDGGGYLSYVTSALAALTSSSYSKYNIVAANLSLGNANAMTESELQSWEDEFSSWFTLLRNNEIVPVVAAGNESENTTQHVPARCDNAVTVSALEGPNETWRENGYLYYSLASSQDYNGDYIFDDSYSNYGTAVDISAPGSVISSASNSSNSEYVWKAGTSMAAPHVAAAVALFSIDKLKQNATADELEQRLYDCSVDLGASGKDIYYGHGMLNFQYFNGNITHSATNVTVNYDGAYHNISVSVTGVSNYQIYYGFTASSCTITDITTNSKFKNFTNGAMEVYYKIVAEDYLDTIGMGTLTINQANVTIELNNQSSIYGENVVIDQTKYTKKSGIIYGTDNLGIIISTTATNISPVNEYDIVAEATNLNYNVQFNKGTYFITQRPISISLGYQKSQYGDEFVLDSSNYTITSDNKLVNGDGLDLVLTTDATSTSPIGEYNIDFVSSNGNYSVTSTSGKLEITKRVLIISSKQSSYYGEIILNEDKYSITSGNVLTGDVCTIKLSTNATITSDVDTYDIIATVSNPNYEAQVKDSYYRIYRRPVNIVPSAQESVYGEDVSLKQTEFVVENIANNEVLNITLLTSADSTSLVGPYDITCDYEEDEVSKNYNITKKTGVLTITQRPISISALEQKSEYGEIVKLDESKWGVSSGNLVNSDTIIVQLSTTADNTSVVGEDYEISVSFSGEDAKNYSITPIKGKLIIEQRKLEIIVLDQETVFGKEISLNQDKYSIESGSVVNGDSLNIVLKTEATSTSEIGEYEIYLTYDNENYSIEQIKGTLFVKERAIEIKLEPQTSVYGEKVVLDQTKFDSDEDISGLEIVLSVEASNLSSVGDYDIIATTSNPNVMLSYNDAKLTITPRPIDIQIENQSCVYGSVILNNDKYDLAETVNEDDVNITLKTNATNSSKVNGEYEIWATTDNKNYTLVQDKGILSLTPMNLTITLKNQINTYGEINLIEEETETYTLSQQPINGDELNVELFTNATNVSDIGPYDIDFRFNNDNYVITGDKATLTIEPRKIEISIYQTSVYGETFVLNPNDYNDVQNLVINNDDLKLKLTTQLDKNLTPNVYDIEVVSENGNYIVDVTSAKVEILIKSISVNIGNNTSVYGEEVDVSDTEYLIDGIVEGDDLGIKLKTDATNKSVVKTYAITAECLGEDVNRYSITINNGELLITKRSIQLTVIDQQGIYGEEIKPKILYEETSDLKIVNDDNLNLKAETEANSTSPVGAYRLTLSWENENYDVEVVDGWFIISVGDIAITILPQSFVYGEEIKLEQLNFETSFEIDKSVLGITLITRAKQFDDVGNDYEIEIEYSNKNYEIAWEPGKLAITQKQAYIKYGNQTSVYGDIAIENKFELDGVVNNDDLGVKLSTVATNTSKANKNYEINYSWTNTNYNLSASETGTMFITPREITIKTEQEGVYGSNIELFATKYTVEKGTIVNNDNLGLIFTTTAKKYSPVTTYEVDFIYENKNYKITLDEQSYYEVLPREIKIAINQDKYYGDDVVLNPNNYNIVYGSIVNNDNLNLILSTDATKESSVNKYEIKLLDNNPNYRVILTSGVLNVCKRIIVIEAIKSGEYGEYFALNNSYDIVDGSIAFATDELNVLFATEATSASPIGVYDLLMSYNNENYDVELRSTSHFEVTKRILKIELETQSSQYGDVINLNQNAYRIVDGDVAFMDVVNITLLTNATQSSDAGDYSITCSVDNPNYKLDAEDGTYTISKRKVTLKLKKQRIARGITFEVDQDAYEILEGNVLEGDELNVKISTNAKMFSMMGNYNLTATYDNDNYDVEIINSKLFLNISFIDIAVILLVVGVIIFVVVKVIKHKRAKRDNQKLFDKWIKW